MRRRRMAATTAIDPSLSLQINSKDSLHRHHGAVVEEIDGLIRVYKDGHVERPQIVPCVTTTLAADLGVTSQDIVIDEYTNIWARFYVPICNGYGNNKLPLLVYFHGGGFCVGSAAWCCYHQFLAKLAKSSCCLIMSVNYRLAPENPLPAAYEDGFKALLWLKQEALRDPSHQYSWTKQCNFSNIFLAGDSAGANIAYNVTTRLGSNEITALKPLTFKGLISIQPFFGGESRTNSEKYMAQPPRSALDLAAADTYWRLALPLGSNRDHPWCNPLLSLKLEGVSRLRLLPKIMVCISELDILKDRNLEFCSALCGAGVRVEQVMYKGVGHAFQVLSKSQISQSRTSDMMDHIKAFITR